MSGSINKSPYLELRLFIAILMSVVILISDGKFNLFSTIKNYIENSVCWLCHYCDRSYYIFNHVSNVIIGYKKLVSENDELRKELFYKNSELLLMNQYRQENIKLHSLLNSPICNNNDPKLIAKIFFIRSNPYEQHALINQGINSNIYIGQPVIADSGVVGQVISVNQFSSRVLLISDFKHALSVKLKRNNIRMILMGGGYSSELYAEYPSNFIDVSVDDILLTSGLDGRFPEGYPVAKVSNIEINSEKDCTIIQARPIVNWKDLNYVILVFK
ncbi:rod shape-determining protein MreC [Candidatus Blochmanniella floridana]|uniref:Cell shape-determining protein MreC n=1 Tax=Blochmanniella floridana TaxID=203907 RepID=Q7VRC3_BLOFL|nr:rod shape-determining protein MreC [Candidatus Blochmannia floridanus]